ncbi:MAG TPA: hypothetical protein VGL59_02345 [Polyangia bacterium]
MTDYVDGILAGIADFHGSPHVFVLEDENGPLYRLTPINGGAAVFRATTPLDIWSPTPAIEELVRATIPSTDGGFLVAGEFRPVQASSSPRPDLHVRWDKAERDGV